MSRLLACLATIVLIKLVLLAGLAHDRAAEPRSATTPAGIQGQVADALAPTRAWAQEEEPAQPEPEAQEATAGPAAAAESGTLSREALQRKQEELNRREKSLKALEKEIDQKLVRLQELEAKLARMLEEAEEVKSDKLKHLIDVYKNMKAKQAANVLETLDENIAVKILAGMPGRQAGEILTNVQAEKAAKLSEMLTRMQAPF